MERDEALQAQYYKQIEALVMRTTQAPPYCNPREENFAGSSVPSQSLRAIHMGGRQTARLPSPPRYGVCLRGALQASYVRAFNFTLRRSDIAGVHTRANGDARPRGPLQDGLAP